MRIVGYLPQIRDMNLGQAVGNQLDPDPLPAKEIKNEISLRQREDYDVLNSERIVIGSIAKYGNVWSATITDKIGNIYGIGTFQTRKEAVSAIKRYWDEHHV